MTQRSQVYSFFVHVLTGRCLHGQKQTFTLLKTKQMIGLTAWIISVSKGSGSGRMLRSSNSKRTAILVISISSSACKQTQIIRQEWLLTVSTEISF